MNISYKKFPEVFAFEAWGYSCEVPKQTPVPYNGVGVLRNEGPVPLSPASVPAEELFEHLVDVDILPEAPFKCLKQSGDQISVHHL